jgi:hypothetical protein
MGGVRLPETEVPIEMNTGLNDEPGLAENRGLSIPIAPEVLRRLYPTREDYVGRVAKAARAAQRAGAILPYRVEEYVAQAECWTYPET